MHSTLGELFAHARTIAYEEQQRRERHQRARVSQRDSFDSMSQRESSASVVQSSRVTSSSHRTTGSAESSGEKSEISGKSAAESVEKKRFSGGGGSPVEQENVSGSGGAGTTAGGADDDSESMLDILVQAGLIMAHHAERIKQLPTEDVEKTGFLNLRENWQTKVVGLSIGIARYEDIENRLSFPVGGDSGIAMLPSSAVLSLHSGFLGYSEASYIGTGCFFPPAEGAG